MSNNSGPSFNSDQFKAQQRQMWDNAAAGWQTWWETIERGAQKVSDKIVELADINPGDKVLDIATGIGEPAVTAARRVKPNGKVVATDISPQMLEIARTRAKSLGLDNIIEFRETDAEKLDLPDSSTARFDAILSRWGLMFLPNLPTALVRIKQMLTTNGRLSAAVWSAPPKVPLLDLAFATVRKQIDAPAPPPTAPGPFALADIDALKQSFSQAGFKDIQTDTFQITFSFDSPESYTRMHQQVTAPIHAMLANHTDEVKKRAWDSITEAVLQYADSHGRVNLDNEVICIVGRN
ncbi:MAG TPA: methyltransferase domain-containing protein [Nitrososphaeraceae archaeon]|nr:methyltransferase domain-containing protein [Nitrososphaeraceae archaeon]